MKDEERAAWCHAVYPELVRRLPVGDAGRKLALAHAAYESGWGTAQPAIKAGNLWNVTAGSKWKGDVWRQPDADWEYFPSGAVPQGSEWQLDPGNKRWRRRIPQVWRRFASLAECVDDFWGNWMLRPDYPHVRAALEVGDLGSYAARLSAVRFYTLPYPAYLAGLRQAHVLAVSFLMEPPACKEK